MRNLCLAIVALVIWGASSPVSAEEKAATSDLPAALQALNVGETAVVTTSDAAQVRGQGRQAAGVYTFVIQTRSYVAAGSFAGYFNKASLLADPHVINFIVR